MCVIEKEVEKCVKKRKAKDDQIERRDVETKRKVKKREKEYYNIKGKFMVLSINNS